MRISTNEFLLGALPDLLAQQSNLGRLNRQISTGETMLDATSDPAGAGAALGVASEIHRLDYDADNAQSATQQIQQGLSVLQQVTTLIDQLRQTALQGANSGATAASRQALANVAQNALQQLVQLANSRDSSGRYLFAGSKAKATAFQTLANGQVVFAGDAAANVIEVAPSLTVPVTISGQGVFANLPAGNGGIAFTAASSNAGGAYALIQGVTSISQLTAERLAGTQYEVVFSAGAGNTLNYSVASGTGSPGSSGFAASSGTVASGAFSPGADLLFGGLDVRITGTPAAGDRFVVQTAASSSLFQTVQDLVSALGPGSPDQQQIQNALANLDGAQTNILATQATLGASLAEIQGVQSRNNTSRANAQAQLVNLQSANLPQVLANYSEGITALQAAELAFAKVQNLSLFSLIH